MAEPEPNVMFPNALEQWLANKELPRPASGFNVKTELKMTTDGKGIGVFAAQFIPKNTRIDNGHEHASFNKEEAKAFIASLPNDEQRRWYLDHSYSFDGKMKINLEDLDTMMVNHSNNPTVVTRPDGTDYTTRDVHVGEELTEDYRAYEFVPFFEDLCEEYGVLDSFLDENEPKT